MSALAYILLKLGYQVSGSDVKASDITQNLQNEGARIYIGHQADNLSGAEMAVYSSSIPIDNPEIIKVNRQGIPILPRGQLLAELMNQKDGIAVCGTHGKTTTSALIAHVLYACGCEPTIAVGAYMSTISNNAYYGRGHQFVAEADESDGSFLYLSPLYSVITNIEREHLDYYKNLESILQAYTAFANKTREQGKVLVCRDDKNLRDIIPRIKPEVLTYGFSRNAEIRAVDIRLKGLVSEFRCIYKGRELGSVKINLPHKHNILNSLAAIGIGLESEIDFKNISRVLPAYKGAKRRFEVKGTFKGITVIEDYAHHPTEIKATLNSASLLRPARIVAVFQPHRYSRTKHLKKSFGQSLMPADHIILTDIYSASEVPIEGISTKLIYQSLIDQGHKSVELLNRHKISRRLADIIRPEDIVLIMGAGDIGEVSDELIKRLKK